MDDDDEGPFVCHECIGDDVISAEIEEGGVEGACEYCSSDDRPTVSIKWLATRVDDVFRELVGIAESMPYVTEHDNVHWIPNGESPSSLLTEMIEAADTEIADAVISELGERHSWDIYEGDFDFYDDTEDKYALRRPNDPRYRDLWRRFCESLKHGRRFFSEDAESMLDEILGPILSGKNTAYGVAIREIGPESEDRHIYRARVAHHEGAWRTIYAAPIKQLAAPPPAHAGPGRMNVAGIPVFYGSFESDTCVAETRIPVGGSAVVGKFEIVRPLRLLDLTKLGKIKLKLSYFHPDYFDAIAYSSFLSGFHDEIKRPVLPGQEGLEYLPTQVVAEYLWTRKEHGVEGIIFGSAQMSGERANIVLFPHALEIEGAGEEQPRDIVDAYFYSAGDPDDPEPPVHSVSYRKAKPKPVPLDEPGPEWPTWPTLVEAPKPAPPAPTLRFTGEMTLSRVTAIMVEVDDTPVALHEHDDNPPF